MERYLAIMDRVQEASCEESWISDIMFKDTVQALTPRERRIIALRYLSGQTQMQVAQAIGISQAQVSRLEKCALEPTLETNLLPLEPSHVHHPQPQHIPWSKGDAE